MKVPFVYLMDQANAVLNEGKQVASAASLTMLLSLIGAANAVGRVFPDGSQTGPALMPWS